MNISCPNCKTEIEINQDLTAEVKPTKECPFCCERILFNAIKCKHCNEMLNVNQQASTKENNNGKGIAIASMILGIFSMLSFFSFILSILAIVFSNLAYSTMKRSNNYEYKSFADVGSILGIISFIVGVVVVIIAAIVMGFLP